MSRRSVSRYRSPARRRRRSAAPIALTDCSSPRRHRPASTATTPAPHDAGATPTTASRPSPSTGRVVYRGNPARRMVALTFDAGATPVTRPTSSTTLQREGVRATLRHHRPLGRAATATCCSPSPPTGTAHQPHLRPRLVHRRLDRRAAAHGRRARARAVADRDDGVPPHQRSTRPYFRPPYGDIDASVQARRRGGGLRHRSSCGRSTRSAGRARRPTRSSSAAWRRREPGAIYVMHVGSQSQDAAALPRVIEGLRAAGYEFGTIDEVLR